MSDDSASPATDDELEELRKQVESKYDFDDFGPRDMAEMTAEEWDAVFDPDSWITGHRLLDRVEADLKHRVADRDVFARIERLDSPDRVAAVSDEGYAVVFEDGTVSGQGTVLRDVEPSVALCSMESYDAPDRPAGEVLPHPDEIAEGTGSLGHTMLLVVGSAVSLMGLGLIGASIAGIGEGSLFGGVFGGVFVLIGLFVFVMVANARLSDRFRAAEYRDRLRAVGRGDGESAIPLEQLETDNSTDETNETPQHGL